jgi:hypothetical protein
VVRHIRKPSPVCWQRSGVLPCAGERPVLHRSSMQHWVDLQGQQHMHTYRPSQFTLGYPTMHSAGHPAMHSVHSILYIQRSHHAFCRPSRHAFCRPSHHMPSTISSCTFPHHAVQLLRLCLNQTPTLIILQHCPKCKQHGCRLNHPCQSRGPSGKQIIGDIKRALYGARSACTIGSAPPRLLHITQPVKLQYNSTP